MSAGKGKRLVYISEELLSQAAKVSRDEDISLGKLVENSLQQAVKVNKLGFRTDQMAELFNVLQANRVLGGLFVPSGVLDFMVTECCKTDPQHIQNLWLESGKWTGKYIAEKFADPVLAFKSFLELSRWDLNEVDVTINGNFVKVRGVSTVMSLENTKLLCKFIEGVVTSIGYIIQTTDCMRGMIIVTANKQAPHSTSTVTANRNP